MLYCTSDNKTQLKCFDLGLCLQLVWLVSSKAACGSNTLFKVKRHFHFQGDSDSHTTLRFCMWMCLCGTKCLCENVGLAEANITSHSGEFQVARPSLCMQASTCCCGATVRSTVSTNVGQWWRYVEDGDSLTGESRAVGLNPNLP